jgi:hypothetical protein
VDADWQWSMNTMELPRRGGRRISALSLDGLSSDALAFPAGGDVRHIGALSAFDDIFDTMQQDMGRMFQLHDGLTRLAEEDSAPALSSRRLSELTKQAEATGVPQDVVDAALDSADPRGALIDVLSQGDRRPGSGFGPSADALGADLVSPLHAALQAFGASVRMPGEASIMHFSSTQISSGPDGIRIVVRSPLRSLGFLRRTPRETALPVPLTAPFSGIFDPLAVPLHMGVVPPPILSAEARGDQFVHEVLAKLGLRLGNRTAVRAGRRVPGPPACAEDTRAYCAEAAEVLRCLSEHSAVLSAGCSDALEQSLPSACRAELDQCAEAGVTQVLECLEERSDLDGLCAHTYAATRAHIEAVKPHVATGSLTVVNANTGKERPLACDANEQQYYSLFDHFEM